MKKLLLSLYVVVFAVGTLIILPPPVAQAADYTNSRMMDDAVFDNVNSMSEAQIQSFLAAKGPCLANATSEDANYSPATGWVYSGLTLASHTIYKTAQMWGLNPQVIITTLQKESSLVTTVSCDAWRYSSAMGYACPDSGGCNSHYAGLTRQILWGSWQLKFNKERSLGNTGWNGDGASSYVGFMTQGTRKRCATCTANFYDGTVTLDGQPTFLETGATAALYTYTPHLNQSFPGLFESYFGSVMADPNPARIVWRLYSPTLGVHFYTVSVAERDNAIGKLGYRLEGGAFIGYAGARDGMVPVYRLWAPGAKYFFYTNSLSESIAVQQQLGYQMNGVAFYEPQASSSVAPKTLSVYRLLNLSTGRHLLTTDLHEREVLSTQGWRAEGISFYAY